MWRWEDEQFKVILGYIANLRTTLATRDSACAPLLPTHLSIKSHLNYSVISNHREIPGKMGFTIQHSSGLITNVGYQLSCEEMEQFFGHQRNQSQKDKTKISTWCQSRTCDDTSSKAWFSPSSKDVTEDLSWVWASPLNSGTPARSLFGLL